MITNINILLLKQNQIVNAKLLKIDDYKWFIWVFLFVWLTNTHHIKFMLYLCNPNGFYMHFK